MIVVGISISGVRWRTLSLGLTGFFRATLATAAMREGDYEDALDLLEPLFSRREFHISEFNSLCSAVIEFSLLTEQYHSARVWFDTWSQPDPKNPRLDFYRELLQKINA